MKTRFMLIGLGDLGSILLESLAAPSSSLKIVVGARDTRKAEERCNIARLGARARGCDVDVRVVPLDLNHVEATAETLHREQPAMVLSTATLSTWWHGDSLPTAQLEQLNRAGFGVWLAVHLLPTLRLMRAVKMASYAGLTLTAPFPDVVNQVLGKVGLAPTCGIGNVAEVVPKLEMAAAKRLGCLPDRVRIRLVAHHAMGEFAFRDGIVPGEERPQFLLRIEHDGRDVTEEVNGEEMLFAALPLTAGRATHFLTANTAVRLIDALRKESPVALHVPGPAGLPGGYPVLASSAGVRLDLGPIAEAEAVAVNEASHRFDGIDHVEADGTAVICEENAERMYKVLGYRPRRITIEDVEEQAAELMSCFRAFSKQYGVNAL